MKKARFKINSGERSFSLVETIVAIGLLVIFVVEVAGVQGNAVYFAEYSRRSAQAMWLARALMAKVEYAGATRAFTDLQSEEKNARFDDFPDYTYDFSIQEWKLPVAQLLGAGSASEEDEGPQQAGASDPLTDGIAQVLGDDLFRIAHVEVFWAEGAIRNSVTLTYLLTNQRKIDEFVGGLKSVYDSVYKPLLAGTEQRQQRQQGRADAPGRGDRASTPSESGGQ